MVYPWISLDILGYSCLSESRFLGWPVLLVSCNAHTFVSDQQCYHLLHVPPWRLCQGERWSTKGSLLRLLPLPLPLAFAAAALAAAASSSPGPDSSSSPSPWPWPAAVAAVANSNILAMGDVGLSCHQMGNQIASSKGIARQIFVIITRLELGLHSFN